MTKLNTAVVPSMLVFRSKYTSYLFVKLKGAELFDFVKTTTALK